MARPPEPCADTHTTMRTPIAGRPYRSDPSNIIIVITIMIMIEVATKCIGSIDYWESLTNRIHGSFSSRSTMRVLVDP